MQFDDVVNQIDCIAVMYNGVVQHNNYDMCVFATLSALHISHNLIIVSN